MVNYLWIFQFLEYFNTKLLEKNKEKEKQYSKNIFNNNRNEYKKKIYNDMIFFIKVPYIIVEQYVKSKTLFNNFKNKCLTSNFINILGKCKIYTWSKKILKLINDDKDENIEYKSSLNLLQSEDINSFNEDNNNDNNPQYDDYINKYHNYKKISKSFNYKKKRVNL